MRVNMNIPRVSARGALSTLTALLALGACAPQGTGSTAASATAPKPVATVNGVALSRDVFDFLAKSGAKGGAELTAEQKNQALDSLVRAEVVAQQAEKDGLDKKGDAVSQLALARLQILEQASMSNYLKDRKPTDAELKGEYDAQVAAMAKTQYHAHHILLKSKDDADKVIAQLKKGAKFEVLAKTLSSDTGSKTNGGDLGWFSPAGMVKPFADAVQAMKKGETSAAPVQSDFGWHVIRLDETRESTPPAFDTVKDRLVQIVEAKKFKSYQDDLIKAAKVEKSL